MFYTRISGLAKINCALSSIPAITFLRIILLEPVQLQTCLFQYGGLCLRFQFGDKYKGEKSDLLFNTDVNYQRPSSHYIIQYRFLAIVQSFSCY